MKHLLTLIFWLLLAVNLFGQADKVAELVRRGVELNDQGNYDEAIAKFKEALSIDKNSTAANYELSYTCMTSGKYEDAIKYSKKVIKINVDNQHQAYIVLGSSLDLTGKPKKAIKTYLEGLEKYPNSNLLNYNLAYTYFQQKEYNKAEAAAISAINAKPTHPSSHLILSATMMAKGERLKAVLPLYYFLMLEPNSQRSKPNYISLRKMLVQGIEQKDENNISVNVSVKGADDEFSGAEMMVSLLAASRYSKENRDKSDMELFVESTRSAFSILSELKKDKRGFWWDLYVTKFNDLVETKNYEAFCYYISKSLNADDVKKWIADNPTKMDDLKAWMKK